MDFLLLLQEILWKNNLLGLKIEAQLIFFLKKKNISRSVEAKEFPKKKKKEKIYDVFFKLEVKERIE